VVNHLLLITVLIFGLPTYNLLLNRGRAEPSLSDALRFSKQEDVTALMRTAWNGNIEIVQALVQAGARTRPSKM